MLFFTCFCVASNKEVLVTSFKKTLNKFYTENDLFGFFSVLDTLPNQEICIFKYDSLYTNNIDKLTTGNIYQRTIAYKLFYKLHDTSRTNIALLKLETEKEDLASFWLAIAIMNNLPLETNTAFNYLIKNEDFGDPHLIPFLIKMDKQHLIITANNNISNPNNKAKVIALQALADVDSSSVVDTIIRTCIKTWDISIKGYAIDALSYRKSGHLKSLLVPYLKYPQLRNVVKSVLESSGTLEDRKFAKQLKPTP